MKERIPAEFIRAIPKSDLHLHLDGSLRLSTLIELAREAAEWVARNKILSVRLVTTDWHMRRAAMELGGLLPDHVEVLGVTRELLHYRLPKHLVRRGRRPVCIGQKQRWFVLRLRAEESRVRLDAAARPEFDDWRWVDYWQPAEDVVFFKREVYQRALEELALVAGAHVLPRRAGLPVGLGSGPSRTGDLAGSSEHGHEALWSDLRRRRRDVVR